MIEARVQQVIQEPSVENAEQKVILFTLIPLLDLKALRPGDNLDAIVTLEDLDTAVDYLAAKLCKKSLRGLGLKASSSPRMRTLAQYYRHDADQRHCLGEIRGFEAVIRSNEPGMLSFQAKGNLYSSGKKVGEIDRMNILTVTHKGNPALDSTLLNKGELDRQLSAVLRKSQGTALLADYPEIVIKSSGMQEWQ